MNNIVDFKKLKGKKILITGATGFLGKHLSNILFDANDNLKLGCTIHAMGLNRSRVDLTKPFDLSGYDYIFHVAGYGQPAKFINDPSSLVKINVDATMSLLDGSPKATFVFFSSAEVYGDIPKALIPVKEDFNGNCSLHTPRSVYAEAKRLGEAICVAYKRKNGTNIKIVRISHVYGPGLSPDDTRVMSEFIRKAKTDKVIKLLDSGSAVKTYGYIGDVISMILFVAIESKGMVYNVGGKDSLSILDLASKIAKYFKIKCEVPKIDSKLSHIGKDPVIVKLDLSKIRKEMKKFKFTRFSEGLKKTIEWSGQNS